MVGFTVQRWLYFCVCSYKRLWLLLTSSSSILFGFLQLHADIKIWWPCFSYLKNNHNHSKPNVMHQCCTHMFVVLCSLIFMITLLLMSLYLEFWADTTLRPCVKYCFYKSKEEVLNFHVRLFLRSKLLLLI